MGFSFNNNIIMQKLIKQTHSHPQGFKSPLDDQSDFSSYFVNNSFRSYLHPKRASVDIKLYLQLHKKILRKAIIEQNFEDNLYIFEHSHMQTRKGFIGNAKHESFFRRTNISQRSKRASTDSIRKQTVTQLKANHDRFAAELFDQYKFTKAQTTPLKPNITHNLSVYRKKLKRKYERQQQFSFEIPDKQTYHQYRPGAKVKTVI